MRQTRSIWALLCVSTALGFGLTGCGQMPRIPWPWADEPVVAPEIVDELKIDSPAADQLTQYWERNTLVVDMTNVAAPGRASLSPAYERGWPMRVAVKLVPGRVTSLEARGAQRVVLPVTPEGAAPVTLELPPAIHVKGTPQVDLTW